MGNSLSLASLSGSAMAVIGSIVFFLLDKAFLGCMFIVLAIILAVIAASQ